LALALLLASFAACLDSGVGGYGQPCNKYGLCLDWDPDVADQDEAVVCCPNTGTCISQLECYGPYTPPSTGGEFEPCNEDNSCDMGLVCCATLNPVLCRQPEDCPEDVDGDEDGDADGDVPDGDLIDGDEIDGDVVDGDTDIEIPIDWPEAYTGRVCTSQNVCWDQPWPTGDNLNAVFTSSEGTVWMAGDNGTRIEFDKEVFDGFFGDNVPNLNAIHGSADDDIWAVGAQTRVMHFDGEEWETVTDGVFASAINNNVAFQDVFSDGIGNLYVLGERGSLYKYLDGVWSQLSSSTNTVTLNAMWAIPEQYYMIVGDNAKVIVSYDQFDFSAVNGVSAVTDADLYDVWAADQSSFFVVGSNGTVLLHQEEGNKWDRFDVPAGGLVDGDVEDAEAGEGNIAPNLRAVAGLSANRVFIAGDGGAFYTLVPRTDLTDGDVDEDVAVAAAPVDPDAPDLIKQYEWKKVETGFTEDFLDVTVTELGEVFVVGRTGTVIAADAGELVRDGADESVWHVANRPGVTYGQGVEAAVQAIDITGLGGRYSFVYAGMANGFIQYLDLDSGTWSALDLAENLGAINAIWVRENGFAYFFGNGIGKFDGSSMEVKVEADAELLNMTAQAVWGFADNKMWTVGSRVVFNNGVTWDEITEPLVNWDFGSIDGDVDGDLDYEDLAPVSPYEWKGVWGQTSSSPWVVGLAGTVANRIPNPLSQTRTPDYVWRSQSLGDNPTLNDIWGSDDDEIWIVGDVANLWYYDGNTFTKLTVSGAVPEENFIRIFGLDSRHLFISSDAGKVYMTSDGQNFAPLSVGYLLPLGEIYGPTLETIFFAGANGTILRGVDLFEEIVDGDTDGDRDDETDIVVDGDQDVEVEEDLDVETDGDLDVEVEDEAEVDVETEAEEIEVEVEVEVEAEVTE
jgi:photosystem II stability/assembly factor-like uncharacterized protein